MEVPGPFFNSGTEQPVQNVSTAMEGVETEQPRESVDGNEMEGDLVDGDTVSLPHGQDGPTSVVMTDVLLLYRMILDQILSDLRSAGLSCLEYRTCPAAWKHECSPVPDGEDTIPVSADEYECPLVRCVKMIIVQMVIAMRAWAP
jgi:hypothetical protein